MSQLARDNMGAVIQSIYPGTASSLSFNATSAQSAAMGTTTTLVRLLALGADCRVLFGTNPTAVATSMLLKDGIAEYFAIKPGDKIAAIRNASTDGTLSITEAADFAI